MNVESAEEWKNRKKKFILAKWENLVEDKNKFRVIKNVSIRQVSLSCLFHFLVTFEERNQNRYQWWDYRFPFHTMKRILSFLFWRKMNETKEYSENPNVGHAKFYRWMRQKRNIERDFYEIMNNSSCRSFRFTSFLRY